jgi:predicted DNA binding CopG/RHH family protein
MRKKITNYDFPIGELERVQDFLPPPDQLVIPEETLKVTIALTKSSLGFFKREAKKHHTKYQRMIRELLDRYALQYNSG